MTVAQLVAYLQKQDQDKRVVVVDQDGAGHAEDVQNVDQRNEKGEDVIAIWYNQ